MLQPDRLTDMDMSSSRPYLIRAMYEWVSDNDLTPYILVNAQASGARVPDQFVEDGKIILNLSQRAVSSLQIDNDWMSFSARFSGKSMEVWVPIEAVLAIYAKENGKGMVFNQEGGEPAPPSDPGPGSGKSGKPRLQLVK